MAKVYVDKDLCIGCGACTGISDSFEFGDDGLAEVKEDKQNEINDDVKEAEACCPTGAIKIEE